MRCRRAHSLLIFLVSVRPLAWRHERISAPNRPSLAGSRRSTGRGVKKPGGEIDPIGVLPVGEGGF
jgi:hypothetical protein